MKELKEHIKSKMFSKCYLLYGDESFLKKTYEKRIKNAIIPEEAEAMNYNYLEGKGVEVSKVIDYAETLPFLNDKRLVFIKDSGLFQSGKNNDSEKLSEFIESIPESTCIVFSEDSVDKRGKLYKAVNKYGYAVEFKTPNEKELVNWIARDLNKNGIKVSSSVAVYFIRTVGADMEAISSELEKLAAYKEFNGQLTNEDIDAVCIKSLETKIFDLVGAIGNKKPEVALTIYNNLIMLKESPLMVLAMISRQLRLILQCKSLSGEGKTNGEIAQILGIRDFVVRECLIQGKNFNEAILKNSIAKCLETDINIKTGKVNQETGVELLIILFAGK